MANSAEMGQINWVVKATVDQATESVKKLSNNISGLSKVLKLVNFTAFIASCKRIGTTIYGLVNQTSQYIQKMNQFKSIMGESAKEAQNFVDKAERILGLDPEQMMGSLSSFQTLTKGFGIASDEAYKMSKNLTQLAADMSSFTGESMDLALQRIKSGISGEIEPMRKWGIALDQATLQETAYALGINKRVAEMTRAQKTELAYYQIMHATQYAQGNMARTMLTPANAIRILQTEFKQLGRAIGSVFIPIALKIIPVIRAIVQVLTELAKKLAALFGFKITDYDFSASTVQDIGESFGDLEDNVNGTTKALKKMLMPFDELNNVNFDTGSGSGGGIGGVGGGSLGLDTYDYDMFAGASDEINKKVEQIKNTLEKLKPIIIAVGGALAAIWAIDKIVTFIEWLKRVKAVSNELSTVLQLALVIGGAFLIYKGIKRAIETDWDAKSLLMMIGGTELIAVAGALKFKSSVPLRIGISIGLALAGTNLLYKGIKHSIDIGTMDGESILQMLGGGSLISAAGALTFKNPAFLTIGILATFDIVLAKSMVDWWKEYFEQEKEQIYGDKQELNLGETIYAGLSAIGEGFNAHVIEKIFGEDALKPITDWVANVMIAFDTLKTMIKNKIDEIKTNVVQGFENFKTNASNKVNEMKNNITTNFETFKTNASNKVNEMKNNITTNFETFKTNASNKVKEMKNNITTNFETFKTNASNKVNEMKNNITTNFENFKNNISQKAEEIKNNITNNFETFKTNASNKINEMKDNITNNFETFKNNISQKAEEIKNNTVTTFENIKTNVGERIDTLKNEAVSRFDNMKNSIKDKITNIKTTISNIFSDIKNTIVGKINDAKEGVRNAIDRIKGLFNFNWSLPHLKTPHLSWTTQPASGWVANILSALNLPTSLPKLNIDWYESGGFPDVGQLFFANESGPELIGNIGNRTAVANQQQITEGIAEATYNAFTRAIHENKNNEAGSYFVINLEGDAIYNGYAKKENRYSNMYGVKL